MILSIRSKTSLFPFYMALCIPIHLWRRTSRVYRDHLHLCRVPTSFVPPAHNQGVGSAPLQGHALWKIFLPTTGSFFVLNLTDLFCTAPKPAPCGGRFPGSFPIPSRLLVTAGFNSRRGMPRAQSNRDRTFPIAFLLSCRLCLRPPDVVHQLLRVIVHALCQYHIEHPQSLACHRHHGLHLL